MRRTDAIFFLSGAAALVYQVVWARLLGRLLGADALGVGLVLALFMGGMAVGSRLAGGWAARSRRPERLYAALLLGLAAWAAASGRLLEALPPVDGLLPRALLAAAALLPPTLAMGATFPVMGRLAIRSEATAGGDTAGLYGANTYGAAAGALLGAFALLPVLGFTLTLVAAAAVDAIAAALAWRLLSAGDPTPEPAAPRADAPPALGRLSIVVALSGCSALALEVLLTRLLVQVTGASVYAFAIVLAVFLAALAYGARIGTKHLADPLFAARALAVAAGLVPVLLALGVLLLWGRLGFEDVWELGNVRAGDASPLRLWVGHALLAALAIAPLAVASGFALPAAIAVALARRGARSREGVLGRLYAANTLGATVGVVVAGFGLLGFVELGAGLWLAALPAVLAAALAVSLGRPWPARPGPLGLGFALAWGCAALPIRWAVSAPDAEHVRIASGPVSTAVVEESRRVWRIEPYVDPGPELRTPSSLRIDGKVVASSAPIDLRLQRLLSAVPAVAHGDVGDALVIGLGTGMTAGALLDLPELRRLEVVELSSAVVAVVDAFDDWNNAVLDDPRTALHVTDGRHFLRTNERRWDLITADPIHPWTRGSSDLYALEHFEAIREHLAPGGVASQWLPLYQLSLDDVRTVVATWCAAFPSVSATLTAYDLALVGSVEALPTAADLAARSLPPALAASLAEAGVHGAPELAALGVADDAALRAFAGDARPMREDRPTLEFSAPRSYLAGLSTEALEWAAASPPPAGLPDAATERAREVRRLLRRYLDDRAAGVPDANARYGERLLALPPLGPR